MTRAREAGFCWVSAISDMCYQSLGATTCYLIKNLGDAWINKGQNLKVSSQAPRWQTIVSLLRMPLTDRACLRALHDLATLHKNQADEQTNGELDKGRGIRSNYCTLKQLIKEVLTAASERRNICEQSITIIIFMVSISMKRKPVKQPLKKRTNQLITTWRSALKARSRRVVNSRVHSEKTRSNGPSSVPKQ